MTIPILTYVRDLNWHRRAAQARADLCRKLRVAGPAAEALCIVHVRSGDGGSAPRRRLESRTSAASPAGVLCSRRVMVLPGRPSDR